MGLEELTRVLKGCKMLQGVTYVTRGYLELPAVTKGHSELQGVTEGYRGLKIIIIIIIITTFIYYLWR